MCIYKPKFATAISVTSFEKKKKKCFIFSLNKAIESNNINCLYHIDKYTISYYNLNIMKKEVKNVIYKRMKFLNIAKVTMLIGAGVTCASFIAILTHIKTIENLKSKTNYEQDNALYQQSYIENLVEQFNNGEISEQTYKHKINRIPDLNLYEYMQNDDSVPTDVLEQYNASSSIGDIYTVGFMGGLGIWGISSFTALGTQISIKRTENEVSLSKKDDEYLDYNEEDKKLNI